MAERARVVEETVTTRRRRAKWRCKLYLRYFPLVSDAHNHFPPRGSTTP
jgi:hypothetical protein